MQYSSPNITKHCGWSYLFFKKNSSWSSKFYFGWFDPDWKQINLDFLGNGGIGRKRIEIKNDPNMGGVLEVLRKIHFDPLTLKIM